MHPQLGKAAVLDLDSVAECQVISTVLTTWVRRRTAELPSNTGRKPASKSLRV